MIRVERHPRVDNDVDEALAYTLQEFGVEQVVVYERLIVEAFESLRHHPQIGHLREDLGPGIRVLGIGHPGIKAPHGFLYPSAATSCRSPDWFIWRGTCRP